MEQILNTAFNTGDIKIIVVAVILYLIIHYQRSNTSKKRDNDKDNTNTRLALLESKSDKIEKLDLDARLASIETTLQFIKEKLIDKDSHK